MHKKLNKRILAFLLSLFLVFEPGFSGFRLLQTNAEGGTVNTDRLNLRSGPGTGYSSLGQLSANTKVEITEKVTGSDGKLWYKVNVGTKAGYLRSDYVNGEVVHAASDAGFETLLDQEGFPESYKNMLRGLHSKYPNWEFKAFHTGLDWNKAVSEESRVGLNLVASTSISSWKSIDNGGFDWANNYWPGYDGKDWVAASPEIIKYYMDPRNFLTDPDVFQFEVQTYDPSLQNMEGLTQMVKGTFLEGYPGTASGGANVQESGSGPSVSNVNPVNTGSDGNSQTIGPVVSASPQASVSSAGNTVSRFFGFLETYAGWEMSAGRWYYLDANGEKKANGWHWIDGNNDGIAECYYFDSNGLMASDCIIDGYTLNSDGAWTVDGIVQTKIISSSSAKKYTDLIMDAAKASGVSPYVLAAMIIQEQGVNGTSPLISGTYGSYSGYYNFYNTAAYAHDGMTAIEAGLKYASQSGNGNRPWNSIEKAIVGGAIAYGENYTKNGQDTFYLKKFNVQGSNIYKHQFMSNVIAAWQEGAKVAKGYPDEIKSARHIFRIPVYKNMPESPEVLPSVSGNPNNKLSSISIDGFGLTPTFNMDVCEYSLIVDENVSSLNISATAIDSKAVIEGTGVIGISPGLNTLKLNVKAENGTIRVYTISVTRKNGSGSYNTAGPSQIQQVTDQVIFIGGAPGV